MPAPDKSSHPAYRPDIDGLRAVAVIAVIAFHAYPNLIAGGFVGVDIFFVISGFLISGIILSGLEKGTFGFIDFYKRRVRRIFPALGIVLVACLAFGWFTLLPDEYRQLGKHAVAGAAFVSNFAFWKESGYFDALASRTPLLHLWSLGIEEQFYLAWPLCLFLLWKRRDKLLWGVLALALISFALNLVFMKWPNDSFYFPFTRFWELLVGCVAVCVADSEGVLAKQLLSRASIDRSPSLRNAYAWLGCALLGAALIFVNSASRFPGWWALLPTFGAAFLILAGPHAWINRKVLADPRMVSIGLISYPLYLWHWPLLSFSKILGVLTNTLKPFLIVAAVLLSWATWRYVEKSIRRTKVWWDIPVLATTLAVTALFGAIVFKANGVGGRVQPGALAVVTDISQEFRGIDCFPKPLNFNVCTQTRPGVVDAAVMGDSHAVMLLSGFAAEDPKRIWLAIGNTSCPPVLGIQAEDLGLPWNSDCSASTKAALTFLSGPGSPNLVVLSFFGYYAETTDVAADHIENGTGPSHFLLKTDSPLQTKQEALLIGLRNVLNVLFSHDKQVFLVVDVPELPFVPRDCVKRPLLHQADCSVPRAAVDRRQQGLRQIAGQLKQEFPQLTVFDPLPLLCGEFECRPVTDHFSLYSDSHHLSVRGSEAVTRSLLHLIDARS